MASDFQATPIKAWERQVELVVYAPSEVSSAAILLQGGQEFGLRVSDLHMEFDVTRSQVYSANVAEFKVYNASEATRKLMAEPGKRVRFSAGYRDMGGPVGIFWGSILRAPSSKVGPDWVTTITAVSSLTEATGTLDIANSRKNKLTPDQKQELVNQAVNRIPLVLNYGPDARAQEIIRTIGNQTGLAVNGLEDMPDVLFPNGWTYVGGLRGAMQKLAQMLRASGFNIVAGNTSILVTPLAGTSITVTAAYLTYETGLIEVKTTTDLNIPPKLDKKGNRIVMPETYEFKALLSPKITPNSLVEFDTPQVKTAMLVSECKFTGNNFGGDFHVSGKGAAWTRGAADTLRRA